MICENWHCCYFDGTIFRMNQTCISRSWCLWRSRKLRQEFILIICSPLLYLFVAMCTDILPSADTKLHGSIILFLTAHTYYDVSRFWPWPRLAYWNRMGVFVFVLKVLRQVIRHACKHEQSPWNTWNTWPLFHMFLRMLRISRRARSVLGAHSRTNT